MDATQPEAPALVAALSLGGYTSPHRAAEALSVLLPLLALDDRARAACVCRAWRAAAAHPGLWEELSFTRCVARVNDATLAALCARAGAALRTLSLDADACVRVTTCASLSNSATLDTVSPARGWTIHGDGSEVLSAMSLSDNSVAGS